MTESQIRPEGYALAAFKVLELLLPKLAERGVLFKAELADDLHRLAHMQSARGVTKDCDVETASARAIGDLANRVQNEF